MDTENVKATMIVTVFLIIGFAVATVLTVFLGALNGQAFQVNEEDIQGYGVTQLNESFTASNVSWVSLTGSPVLNVTNPYIIYNATGSVNTTDFTVNLTDGTLIIKATGDQNLNDTSCTIWYEYGNETVRAYVLSTIESAFRGQSQISSYLPLLALAFVVVLVIMLIVVNVAGPVFSFGYVGKNSGGSTGLI